MSKKANTIDLLLKLDQSKLVKPTKDVEIKRLSEIAGEKVIFKCEALSPDMIEEIAESNMSINGDNVDVKQLDIQIFTVIEGVKEPNFKDKELMKAYNVLTPKDLVKKMLLGGEISSLYNLIQELSGYKKDVITEVKN